MDEQHSPSPPKPQLPLPLDPAGLPPQPQHQSLVLQPAQSVINEMQDRDSALAAAQPAITPAVTQNPSPQALQSTVPTISAPASYAPDELSPTGSLPKSSSGFPKLAGLAVVIVIILFGGYMLISHKGANKTATNTAASTAASQKQTPTANSTPSSEQNAENPVNSNPQIKSEVNFCSSSPLTC